MPAFPALEFRILLDLNSLTSGISRAGGEVQRGLRGMAAAAVAEVRRIEAGLGGIQGFSSLKQEVLAAEGAWRTATAEVARLARGMSGTAAPTAAMTRAFEQAKRQAAQLKETFEQKQAALQRARDELTRAGVNTRNLAQEQQRLRAALDAANNSLRAQLQAQRQTARIDHARGLVGLTRTAQETQREITRLQAAYERLARSGTLSSNDLARAHLLMQSRIRALSQETQVWRQHLENARASWLALAAVGAGGAMAVGSVITRFAGFDDVMRQVGAAAGASREEMAGLTALAREMGATTRYSATQAAEGLRFLAMAGMDVGQMSAALPNVLQLAAAGAMDLGRATEIATGIMAGFGFKARELSRVNDVLAAAMTASNAGLDDLGYAFSYVGPIAKGAGLQFEEMAVVLGILANNGYKGERAGTALRGALSDMLKPTETTRAALERLGVKVADDSGKLKSFIQVFRELAASGADTADMMKIFGQEPGPAMQAFLATLRDTPEEIEKLQKKIAQSAGSAQRIATEMEAGIGGALRELSSAFEELILEIGEGIEPAVRLAAKAMAELLLVISELSPASKAYLVVLLTAGTGFALWRLGLGQIVAALRALIPTLATATTGVTLMSRALRFAGWLGVALTVYEIGRALFDTGDAAEEAADKVTDAGEAITTATANTASAIGTKLATTANAVKHSAGLASEAVTGAVALVEKQLQSLKQEVQEREKLVEEQRKAIQEAEKGLTEELAVALGDRLNAIQEHHAAQRREVEVSGQSEEKQTRETTRLLIQESRERENATRRTRDAELRLLDQSYQRERALAQSLGRDLTALDAAHAREKLALLRKAEGEYAGFVDRLIDEEQRYLDAARQAATDRAGFARSIAEKLRELSRKTMSDGQARQDRLRQVEEEQARAKAAMAAGDYETAKEYAEKAIALAEQTAEAVTRTVTDRKGNTKEVTEVSLGSAVTEAQRQIRESAGIVDLALAAREESNRKAAEALNQAVAASGQSLASLRERIAALSGEVSLDLAVNAALDEVSLQAAVAKLQKSLTAQAVMLRIEADLTEASDQLDRFKRGATGIDLALVTRNAQSALRDFTAQVAGLPAEQRLELDTTDAQSKLTILAADVQKLSLLKTSSAHTVTGNAAEVLAQVQSLNGMNTTSTHTVVYQEAHATGGLVGLARGGKLPGYGGGDRVPSMLEAGEFVVRKEAVARYGAGLLHAINRMRFELPDLLAFRHGGIINNLVMPTPLRLPAYALGGAVTPPVAGVYQVNLTANGQTRATATVSSREEARRMVSALEEMTRGRP